MNKSETRVPIFEPKASGRRAEALLEEIGNHTLKIAPDFFKPANHAKPVEPVVKPILKKGPSLPPWMDLSDMKQMEVKFRGAYPHADKPLTVETAISEIEAISRKARNQGRTPLEQVEFEASRGNTKPKEALKLLEKEKDKLSGLSAHAVSKQTKNNKAWNVQPIIDEVVAKVAASVADVAGKKVVNKVNDFIIDRSHYSEAESVLTKIAESGAYGTDEIFRQVAVHLLQGDKKPLEALEFMTGYKSRMNNPVVKLALSENGQKLMGELAVSGVRGLIRLIFGL